MKFRKVIESGIITAALAVSSVTTAVSASAAEVDTTGVVGSVLDRASQIASTGIQSVQITHQNAQAAAAAAAQAAEWANKMLVTVDEDAEVVGKFYHGSGAEVLEVGAEWTKVKSGDVEGYVSNAYCVFGEEARVYAEANCETQATANADGIRVRESYSTDAKILDVIDAGESLKVNTDAENVDGWVSVECNGVTAYVAAAYVNLDLDIDDAVSMEEIRAREAAKAQQAAAAQSGNTDSTATSSAAVSASASDTQLLAAIIECEAGGEPYAGQLAVGAVVMNRVKSGSFPNSISGVIYQSGQFTPARSGKLARVLSNGKISSSCYQAAAEALAGADNTGGAKYFHAGTSGSGLVIGSQIFY